MFQFISQAQSLHVINLSGKKILHVKFPYDLIPLMYVNILSWHDQ